MTVTASAPRVAIYARYSSDNQRDASIADQLRICREFAARQGWTVVQEFADHAISGSTLILRPGVQALLRDALDRQFEIVLSEALDRLSRDLADTAGLFKRFTFAGIRVVTISEGDVTRLHIGLKGLMNESYLDDLTLKTRRGMRGRIEGGKSAGGLSYGYRLVPGQLGDREIDSGEATTVRRIFSLFAAGQSPKAICKLLNGERVPGPHGAAWSPSTIYGNGKRGTGLLNNELYVGRMVWNRLRYVKDPDTGKRVSRLNPEADWITKAVPFFRIIDDGLWQTVKARQAATTKAQSAGIDRARRPKYLLSGLTKCAECGGGFTLSSRDRLRCFNASNRGTCSNTRAILRSEVEARVLHAIQARLFEPGQFERFCEEFMARVEERRREHLASLTGKRRELDRVKREIQKVIEAIKAGFALGELKIEWDALQVRKDELTAALGTTAVPEEPALHPHMAAIFRQKVISLAEGLQDESKHSTAREALRQILERIEIPAGDELLKVVGNLGAMLDAVAERFPGRRVAVANAGCGGGI